MNLCSCTKQYLNLILTKKELCTIIFLASNGTLLILSVVEIHETDVFVWLEEKRLRSLGILRPIYVISVQAASSLSERWFLKQFKAVSPKPIELSLCNSSLWFTESGFGQISKYGHPVLLMILNDLIMISFVTSKATV